MATPLPVEPSPKARRIASVSGWSSSAVTAAASSSAAFTRAAAARSAGPRLPPGRPSWPGIRSTSARRAAASGSVASRLARPMWPCAALAAASARSSLTPSRTSAAVTAAVAGIRSVTSRQRDLIVVGRSSADGAQSSQTVRGAGSSMALSSALAACSVARSASSNRITRQPPSTGAAAARSTSSLVWRTP